MDCQSVLPQIEDPKEELGKYEERNACKKPLEFLPTKPRTESIWWPRANEPLASPVVEASTCAAWREGLGSCCVTYGLVWTPRAVSSLASSLSKLTVGTHSLLLRSDLEMDKSRRNPKSLRNCTLRDCFEIRRQRYRLCRPAPGFEKVKRIASRDPGR